MEENYILARKTVFNKFNEHPYSNMLIYALYGLFSKYPNNKELIIEVFNETAIYIDKGSVYEINDRYDLDIIDKDDYKEEDPNNSHIFGINNPGYSLAFDKDNQLVILVDKLIIICSSSSCGPTQLLNVFIHEFNHIIKSRINGYSIVDNEHETVGYTRCGINVNGFNYKKETDVLEEINYCETLEEVINVFQTTDMMKIIKGLDGIVDCDMQKYLDTLNKDYMEKDFGYEKCTKPFKKIWLNEDFKKILEEHLIDGEVLPVKDKFNELAGEDCFDLIADYIDDIDYLYSINSHRKAMNDLIKKLGIIVDRISKHKVKIKK